jgi:hypothetical protein
MDEDLAEIESELTGLRPRKWMFFTVVQVKPVPAVYQGGNMPWPGLMTRLRRFWL